MSTGDFPLREAAELQRVEDLERRVARLERLAQPAYVQPAMTFTQCMVCGVFYLPGATVCPSPGCPRGGYQGNTC